MNEHIDFERLVAGHIVDEGVTPPSDAFYDELLMRAGGTGQRPAWLALIKEAPMRTNNHLAVGSPTVRVAAILAATLLVAVALAGAGAGAQRLLAANGPIVVAQDGSGAYETINEAVAAAGDGDEILVKPGTYAEVVTIDKDITLRGDGPREEVILEFGPDGPFLTTPYGRVPYGLMLVDTEATISDLTVRGPNVAAAFVFVGGAPTLEGVADELEGDFGGGPHTSVAVLHGAGGTIRDSHLDGPAWPVDVRAIPGYEDISGTGLFLVEDNVSDAGFGFDVTDGSAFLRNTITDGGGLWPSVVGGGSVLIAGNDLAEIGFEDGSSDGVTIRDNTIHADGDTQYGIYLGTGAAVVEGNTISGVQIGIAIPDGAKATITGNQLDGMKVGISVLGAETVPVIEDNRFCGNDLDLRVIEGSSLTLDPSNVICADVASE